MNAMEKVAWTEFLVSAAAVITATLMFPWLGSKATGFFSLLALLPLSYFFVRQRGNQILIDERDREIDRTARLAGIGTAWMAIFMTLIAVTIWSTYSQVDAVSTVFLSWLIWVQAAVCYGTKGLIAVVLYRRQQHAA